MALKKCKECGNQVSIKADKCPNCGAPIKKRTKVGCLGSIILIIFVLIIIGQLSNFFEERSKQKDIREKAIIAEQKVKAVAERQASLRKNNLKFFDENKSTIIAELTDYYEKGNYQEVVAKAKKYLISNDPDLKEIYGKAKSITDQIKRKKRQQEILTQLKRIPVAEFEKNKNLYRELLLLYPNNVKYKEKYEYYSSKLKEKHTKQRLAAERKKKIERQFSAWDGSHRNLERLIKKTMNDPGSYDHVKTVYWEMGAYVVVKTTFRGKNAFGGVVVNWVKAKVDLDGNIIKIIETYP